MTHEEFVKMVERGLDKHISRDPTIGEEDRQWEARNLADRLAALLRSEGFNMPRSTP